MATKMKMKNPQADTSKFGNFGVHRDKVDSYWGGNNPNLEYKGKPIFQYDHAGNMSCCGMLEVSGWTFNTPKGLEYCDDMQKAFNELVLNHIKDDDMGDGTILLFNVTRTSKDKKVVQPEWFVKCLENAPNSYELDWMANTNTGGTDIKMFVIKANA